MLHFQTSCKYINIRNLVLTLVKPLIFSGQNFVDLLRAFERSTWEYAILYLPIDIKLFVLFILNCWKWQFEFSLAIYMPTASYKRSNWKLLLDTVDRPDR